MSHSLAALGDVPAVRTALAAVQPLPELPPWNTDRRPLWQRALERRYREDTHPRCPVVHPDGSRCGRFRRRNEIDCGTHQRDRGYACCGRCRRRIGGGPSPCQCPGAPKPAYCSAPPREGERPRGRPRKAVA